MFRPGDLFDLEHTEHQGIFSADRPVWEAIAKIPSHLSDNLQPEIRGEVEAGAHVGDDVFLGEGSVIEAGASVRGPAWIGKNCTIRSGAYIREDVITGDGVMLGNSCEFKNCLLFDGCEVPHFNYVGDSILGHHAHLGAGVILSNFRLDQKSIPINVPDGEPIDSGLIKLGAIVGDFTEVGCNSVLSPGSILGRRCIIYPGTQWRGVLTSDKIVKLIQSQKIVEKR